MKHLFQIRMAGNRDGGAFYSAHVTRQRPAGTSSFFTSLRRTPRHPDPVTSVLCDGRKAKAPPFPQQATPFINGATRNECPNRSRATQ